MYGIDPTLAGLTGIWGRFPRVARGLAITGLNDCNPFGIFRDPANAFPSQRPPAEPEAWQRRSGSKPHGPSDMASQPRYCQCAPSLSPRPVRRREVGREPERGVSPQNQNRSPTIQKMPPLPGPLLRGAEERENNATAGAVKLRESSGRAGGFPIGFKATDLGRP